MVAVQNMEVTMTMTTTIISLLSLLLLLLPLCHYCFLSAYLDLSVALAGGPEGMLSCGFFVLHNTSITVDASEKLTDQVQVQQIFPELSQHGANRDTYLHTWG